MLDDERLSILIAVSRRLSALAIVRVRLRVGISTLAFLAALCAMNARASASETPSAVRSASLTQHGRSLRWEVKLRGVLSSKAMSRQHRSLCLMFEREGSKAVFSKLCIAPPRSSREGPRLLFSRVRATSAASAKQIAARVTRPGRGTLQASFRPAAIRIGYGTFRWQVQSSVEPPACIPASELGGEGERGRANRGGHGVGRIGVGRSFGLRRIGAKRSDERRRRAGKLRGPLPGEAKAAAPPHPEARRMRREWEIARAQRAVKQARHSPHLR